MSDEGAAALNLATLGELLPRLADGSLSASALLQDCLGAIAAHDRAGARLSAILRLNPEAQADAAALDEGWRRSGVQGPLHGVPVVLKDNIDMASLPTTSGNSAMARAIPHRDAEQTRRLRAAGAVIVGKTNLSEFSFQIRSRSSLGGDVRNPFNREVTAGGSSGGTAAAIAAGFAVAGLGSDTGGSIRTPAAYNGLVGLRPSQGLLDRRGVAPLAPTTDTVAPMARCVGDVARLMAVMSDPPHAEGFSEAATASPDLTGAHIGVLRQAFGADPEVLLAMEAALAMMRAAGAVVVDPVVLPGEVLPVGQAHVVDWEFRPAFDAYLGAGFQPGTAPASLADICRAQAYLPDHYEALLRRAAVETLDAPDYRAILEAHQALAKALDDLFDAHGLDALAYPTSAVVPHSLENPKGGWGPELAARSGRPSLSLPVGQAINGVPIGLELMGRAFEDAALLALAAALEQRLARRYQPRLG